MPPDDDNQQVSNPPSATPVFFDFTTLDLDAIIKDIDEAYPNRTYSPGTLEKIDISITFNNEP